MKISFIEIQNFRKLKECQIDFSDQITLLVGANNSGKTSAMDALSKFLAGRGFVFNDITLSNRSAINAIGEEWVKHEYVFSDSLEAWATLLPSLDVWINVVDSEIQYVSHIIPSLDWDGGALGIRFLFQPNKLEDLFREYKLAFEAARKTEQTSSKSSVSLWPHSLCEFLERKLTSFFSLHAYILDPEHMRDGTPQKTDFDMECLERNPLSGLIKIDMISAQRGFSDVDSTTVTATNDQETIKGGSLSTQLRSYYDKHLDPEKEPSPEDLETLQALEEAQSIFDSKLADKFKSAIAELESLGYPGVSDPKITIESKVSVSEVLNHQSAVQYSLGKAGADEYKLPEKYNGLGYQNLISMVFLLIRFRDDRMQVGKAHKSDDIHISPLHIVLLEEPEAHLHVQVQQVFIKKAYDVLRNNEFLQKHADFATQLIISSHSSAIAREVNFADLRYFKRLSSETGGVPTSKVINLSDVFGKEDITDKFVTRYLQTTHCDLFFADAAILVEGTAEKMLVPHFIRNKFPELNQRYITLLEINGSHAHRLQPLIDKLCLTTLIITDIDPVSADGHHSSVEPKRNAGILCGNDTIKSWLPKKNLFDDLLNLDATNKEVQSNTPYFHAVRVAYQTPIRLDYKKEEHVEAIASTLEDALVYSNIALFNDIKDGVGLIKTCHDLVCNRSSFAELHEDIFNELHKTNVKKAEFALDLIYSQEPERVVVPEYISEGLKWLEQQIKAQD